MEPIVEKITLVEDARFDSPKSMFLGRVMGTRLINDLLLITSCCKDFFLNYFLFNQILISCLISVSFRGW